MSITMSHRAVTALALAAALLAAPAAFAEGNSASTMTPPAPNAAAAGYQSENSLPESSETATYSLPGAQLATTQVSGLAGLPASGPSGLPTAR